MKNLRLSRVESDIKRALTEILFNLGYSNIVVERIVFNKTKDYLDVEISTSKDNILFLLKSLKNDEKRLKYFLSKYVEFRKMPMMRFKEYIMGEEMERLNSIFATINAE